MTYTEYDLQIFNCFFNFISVNLYFNTRSFMKREKETKKKKLVIMSAETGDYKSN